MYTPFTIGTRFRILPPTAPPSTDGRIDLVMARGAFGSGEHETTASCIEALEKLPLAGARLLDLGSGTGILAIAALKLGAAHALCIDISPEAVAAARHNCALNGISEEIEHFNGVLADAPSNAYDLVLANIYGDLLLDLAGDLVSRPRPGGLLLLSGMLWEYNFEVRQTYQRLGCTLLENRMLEEFSTVLLRKG